MARANRHYLPGYVWHITHRCHKREFLFRFSKDWQRWLQWLFEARRLFKLLVLNLCGHLQSHSPSRSGQGEWGGDPVLKKMSNFPTSDILLKKDSNVVRLV